MATWFKINNYRNTIVPIEVVKVTPAFITIKQKNWIDNDYTERRVAKGNDYFPTFKDARQYLMNCHAAESSRLREEAERAHVKWTKLFTQEEPDAKEY